VIPDFDDRGYLPPGIHPATLEEVGQRFGVGSELRQAQFQSLRWLVPLCQKAKIIRLVLNGSFVTDIQDPNDVDCVLLQGDSYAETSSAAVELEQGLPFLSLAVVEQEDFDFLTDRMFGTDRDGIHKGLVEVFL
jgi:hypothetical protein